MRFLYTRLLAVAQLAKPEVGSENKTSIAFNDVPCLAQASNDFLDLCRLVREVTDDLLIERACLLSQVD